MRRHRFFFCSREWVATAANRCEIQPINMFFFYLFFFARERYVYTWLGVVHYGFQYVLLFFRFVICFLNFFFLSLSYNSITYIHIEGKEKHMRFCLHTIFITLIERTKIGCIEYMGFSKVRDTEWKYTLSRWIIISTNIYVCVCSHVYINYTV